MPAEIVTFDHGDPVSFDAAKVAARNKENIKKTKDGGSVDFISIMRVVLIGSGHDAALVTAVKKAKHNAGKIVVDKGSLLDKGELIVTGCSGGRHEFESAIKLFSKKKVVYK